MRQQKMELYHAKEDATRAPPCNLFTVLQKPSSLLIEEKHPKQKHQKQIPTRRTSDSHAK